MLADVRWAACAAAMLLASCGDSTGPDAPRVRYLSIVQTAIVMGRLDTVAVTVKAFDADSNPIDNPTLAFGSTDTAVIRVDAAGNVRGTGRIGSALLSVSADTLLRTITVSTQLTASTGHLVPGGPFGVAAYGGMVYYTGFADGMLHRVSEATGTTTGAVTVGALPTAVAINPAGTRAYVSNQGSQSISEVDLATFTVTRTIPVQGDPVPMAVSADGQTLFYATNVDSLFRLALASGLVTGRLALPATSHFITFNPARDRLYVATRAAGTVLEVNPSTMAVLRTLDAGGITQQSGDTPDNSELWVANEAGGVDIWQLASGTRAITLAPGLAMYGLTIPPDGEVVVATSASGGTVMAFDRRSRATIGQPIVGGTPRHAAADPVTGIMVVANAGGWLDFLK